MENSEKTKQKQKLIRTYQSPQNRVAITFPAQGRTKQSFKDECDINQIMSRYMQTGVLPDNLNPRTPQYIDATGFDYDLAMNLVAEASSSFALLPASVREKFDHDPGAFLDFVADPKNAQSLVDMGLATQLPEWAEGVNKAPPSAPLQEAKNEAVVPAAGSPQTPATKNLT